MMAEERFWTKSYDPGLADIDPVQWEKSYVDAVAPIFKKFPAKPALAFMGVEVTFAELDCYANRFAHMLLAQGLKKGNVVGINLPNIPEYVIAWMGILRAGCVVSGVSPLLSAEEMKYQLKDSNAGGLVTLDAIFAARLTGIVADLPDLKVVVTTSVGGFLPAIKRVLGRLLKKIPQGKVTPLPGRYVADMIKVIQGGEFSAEPPEVTLTPDDVAYIQYTGGTTGSPKGAMLTHRSAVADLIIVQTWLGWEEGKGLALSGFPFFHIAGLFFNENCIYADPDPQSPGYRSHLQGTGQVPAHGPGQCSLALPDAPCQSPIQGTGPLPPGGLHLRRRPLPRGVPAEVGGDRRSGETPGGVRNDRNIAPDHHEPL